MYVIAVNKPQEFLLNVGRLFYFFDDGNAVFTSTRRIFFRRRRKGFDFDDESMFFSTTSYTSWYALCAINVHSRVNKLGPFAPSWTLRCTLTDLRKAGLPLTGVYGRIIRQKIWPKRPKLDGPAYEYAQNKMAGVRFDDHSALLSL